MTEKLINDIINILDNVYYWETCPQEYNDKIDVIIKELESELKKLRVGDVSGRNELLFTMCCICGKKYKNPNNDSDTCYDCREPHCK